MIFGKIASWLVAFGLPQQIAGRAAPWVFAGAIVLALAGLLWLGSRFVDRAFESATEAGVQQERAGAAQTIIDNVEKANAARDKVEQSGLAGDRERYCVCLRSARTPANCVGLLPAGETYQCRTGASTGR